LVPSPHVEDERGHGAAAIGLERDALRYSYLAGDVIGIAVSYHNLGNYLHRHTGRPARALACHLAAALIRVLTGADGADRSLRAAATDLRALAAESAEGPAPTAEPDPGKSGTEIGPPPDVIPHANPLTSTDVLMPADAPALCHQLADIPGTDLPWLLAALAPDPATADQTLRHLVNQAQALTAAPPEPAPAPVQTSAPSGTTVASPD
jgi:hypothetical protein